MLTREPSYREVSARQQCVYEGPWKKSTFSRKTHPGTLEPIAHLSAKRLRSYGHFRKCEEYPLLLPAPPITVNQLEFWLYINSTSLLTYRQSQFSVKSAFTPV